MCKKCCLNMYSRLKSRMGKRVRRLKIGIHGGTDMAIFMHLTWDLCTCQLSRTLFLDIAILMHIHVQIFSIIVR